MRALVFEETLRYRDDCPMPEAGACGALIKVLYAGICATDHEIVKGYMDFSGIPGHEFVGVVAEAPWDDVKGRRVTGEINLACGTCRSCQRGMHTHCASRSVLGILKRNGVFAEYVTLPMENLHLIPDSVADEEAVFVEPLAAAFEILDQVGVMQDHDVCVLGDGKMGYLTAQVLLGTGCRLVVYGKHRDKLSVFSAAKISARVVPDVQEREFDIVIDCSGSVSGIETALKIVRPGGRVVVKTTVAESRFVDLNSVVVHELTLIGSRCGPFPRAIEAIACGAVHVRPLVSRVFPLEQGVEAFRCAAEEDVFKVLIRVH